MQYINWKVFSTAQNSFWTYQFWCLLVLLLFCFTSSTSAKCFPLRTFFILGNTHKKVAQGKIGWIGKVGSCWFWSKTTDHSAQELTRVLKNYPSWNGQTCWESSKKIHWSWMQPLTRSQLVHWHRWVPWILTCWGKPVLHGAHPPENISGFFWSPLVL